jgi:hypothetical protein
MFKKIIKKTGVLLFLGAFIPGFNIHAGVVLLTPANYNSSGLYSSTSGTGAFNPAGFSASGGSVTWTISGYNIRNGQSWSKFDISATTAGGTYDVYIYSQSQVVLYSKTALNSGTSVDLTKITALDKGAPFFVKIVLNINLTISSISATYAGNQMTCYPSPYSISTGKMKIVFDVNTSSTATLEIYDNRGRLVKTILKDKAVLALTSRFDNILTWDGKDDNERTINTGIYTAVVRVTPVDTSKTSEKYISTFRVLVIR